MSTGSATALGDYRHLEVVQIVGQPPGVREPLGGSEGILVGCSEPSADGQRHYGVHVNQYGETFSVPAALIRTTGRLAVPADVRTRGRLGGRRAHPV
jgi:hypothetical protein